MCCRDLCVLSRRLCPRAWSEQRLGLAICIYSRHASVAGGLSRTSIAHTRATRRLSARHTCPDNRRAARASVRARARRALQWLARRRRRAPPEWHRRRVAGRAAVPLGIHSHQRRVSVSGAQRCHCAAPRRRGRAHRAERYGGGRAHTYTALHLGACFPLFARSVPASRGALLRRLLRYTSEVERDSWAGYHPMTAIPLPCWWEWVGGFVVGQPVSRAPTLRHASRRDACSSWDAQRPPLCVVDRFKFLQRKQAPHDIAVKYCTQNNPELLARAPTAPRGGPDTRRGRTGADGERWAGATLRTSSGAETHRGSCAERKRFPGLRPGTARSPARLRRSRRMGLR